MRLLKQDDNGNFAFTSMLHEPPPYAILSHTWSAPPEAEVSYKDMLNGTAQGKEAFVKIKFIAEQARKAGVEYFWVDNCCIDKSNDAELSTAIRSMHQWYKNSEICFVYLSDVSMNKRDHDGRETWENSFRNSRWFKRGWTLQELLAPLRVEFYARDGYLGSRTTLCQQIHEITGIHSEVLRGVSLEDFPIPTRLRWAAGRRTTVPEDFVYALMGMCDVIISPMYGEGRAKAEDRLKRKLQRRYGNVSLDQSIWCGLDTKATGKTLQQQAEDRKMKLEALAFRAIDSRRTTISNSLKNTCKWILTHPRYMAWRDVEASKQHHGFFWIQGKPGAGKSVLVKHLDMHISKRKAPQDICISFYFHARGEQLQKSLEGMYRSLLTQLFQAHESSQVVLDEFETIFDDANATIPNLRNLLRAAIKKLGDRQLFCFIDALDECEETDMQYMIDDLRELCDEATENGIRVNICFASRYYPALYIPTELRLGLDDLDEHTNDLKEYIKGQRFPVGISSKTTEIPAQIQNDILRKANGVFLWIVLVIEILKKEYRKGFTHAVKKRLQEIPQDLHKLFEDIVQRDQENIDVFILCLRWILYAKRPFTLKEFYFAMMAGIDDPLNWSPESHDDDIMHSFLRISSKGLAELTKDKESRVQFIHESVRDFLTTGNGFKCIDSSLNVSACHTHEILKQCCLRGLQLSTDMCYNAMEFRNSDVGKWQPSRMGQQRALLSKCYPFLDYAMQMVFYHSDQAALEVDQWEFLHHFDLDQWRIKVNFLQQHDKNIYTSDVDLPYILAERDNANLIRILAEHNVKLDSRNQSRNALPLIAAFANRSKDAATVLLEQYGFENPDQLASDIIVNNYKGRAAYDLSRAISDWWWALQQGYKDLAEYFLSKHNLCSEEKAELMSSLLEQALTKGRVETVDFFLKHGAEWTGDKRGMCSNALPAAAEQNHFDVAQLLIAHGANVNVHRGFYSNALQAASFKGHVNMAKLLIAHGAELNAQGGVYSTAIQAAAYSGHVDMAKLLIAHGADVHAQGETYSSALQAAAYSGHVDMAKLLIAHGADVHAQRGFYGSALQAAAYSGHVHMAKLLIAHGADVNVQGGTHGDALHAAAYCGHVDMAKLLIAHGADVHAQGGLYSTAIQAAACSGHVDMVELLIAHSADVNVQGGTHNDALQAAAYCGHVDMAEFLIAHGADVHAQGGFYGNALQTAAYNGHVDMAKLLIAHGADVNAQGGLYSNALQAAACRGHVNMVKLLREHGA